MVARAGGRQGDAAGHIAAAVLAIGGAYFTLSFYDFFALRVIGAKHVPYRIAALASFTSYAIGHNIGATASPPARCACAYSSFRLGWWTSQKLSFSPGSPLDRRSCRARYRMVYRPEVSSLILQISPGRRAIAVTALVVLSAYIVWDGRAQRSFGRNGGG